MMAEVKKYPTNWPCGKSCDKLWEHVVNINEVIELVRDVDLTVYHVRLA